MRQAGYRPTRIGAEGSRSTFSTNLLMAQTESFKLRQSYSWDATLLRSLAPFHLPLQASSFNPQHPQESSMADDALVLKCLIQGRSAMIIVETTGSMDIIDLKYLIREEGRNSVFRGVDAYELTLWKVRMTMASDNTANFPAG